MADILITHCNHLYFDRKQVRKMQPYPPMQAMLAAACLRQAGFEVALFDSTLEEPENGFGRALVRHRPRLVFLCEDNFNYLTKMCLTRNRELAFFMARAASTAGVPVVAAGSDVSDRMADYLAHGTGFAIYGEVEGAIAELAGSVLRNGSTGIAQIRGIAWRDPATGSVRINPPRPPLTDLDALPCAAWDLIDVDSYRSAWLAAHGYFSLNMVASRGCPYRCNWCAKPIYGSSYHTRSAWPLAREMAFLKGTYSPDHIWFADDIFALTHSWTLAFAEAVDALDARLPFKMQSRCDLMTRDTVWALRRAGCVEVWMGAESGSQKVLDAMDKGIRVEQIYQACHNLRSHDIRACLFLQFGYPGETWDDIGSTIRMVRETRPHEIGVSVAYPLPGTRFYDAVKSQLGRKRNWEDSDDLAMMFQGAYTSEFYRGLRDALHLEVSGGEGQEEAWRRVEALEKTSATANPTVLWTCC
jgi:radical SAM superfamily enzyme YgiQ (UPF0313 family)